MIVIFHGIYRLEMPTLTKAIIISIAVVLLAGLWALTSFTNMNKGNNVMKNNGIIPPIDASTPVETETATFALG